MLKTWGAQNIDLRASTALGRSYEAPNISAKFYDSANIPDSSKLFDDLKEILEIYKSIEGVDFEPLLSVNNPEHRTIEKKPSMKVSLSLSKPFILLAGISGTGKTRFIREQAKHTGQFYETYCLTSVRPDWHEPSDLLGYVSRLGNQAEYISTDVLQFIAKAWRGIADSGLDIEAKELEVYGKRLVVSGESHKLKKVLPYWLCLDEMNLAPVEQYFADYLSVLETREWQWYDKDFIYICDSLLKPSTIKEAEDNNNLRQALGFEDFKYDKLWSLICDYGLGIPFNLIVAGTVNMDETTYGFSRKVIDRALSFDFGEFFPNDFDVFFGSQPIIKILSFPVFSDSRNERERLIKNKADPTGELSITFLKSINNTLLKTPFELAYRALNELLLSVIAFNPKSDLELKAVWDDFLMCKVLPRIEGDVDKLSTVNGNNLLEELENILEKELAPIWNASNENDQRPDLYRENIIKDGSADETKIIKIPCRSKAKLTWMKDRLEKATFTSFWP